MNNSSRDSTLPSLTIGLRPANHPSIYSPGESSVFNLSIDKTLTSLSIMKLPVLLTALVLPLAIQGNDVDPPHWEWTNPVCWREHHGLSFEWKVSISPVPQEKVGDICHKFWRGLRQFGQCSATSTDCSPWNNNTYGLQKHGVKAHFWTSVFCNGGMVQAAFWEGTHNDYGGLNCY